MIEERNYSEITKEDLIALLQGSMKRIESYFVKGNGAKWQNLYDVYNPLCVALCQGAAMHYQDKKNGIKDFDIWFFYPYNQKHLPYRPVWNWDLNIPKFGRHPEMKQYKGRKVDVMVRSLKKYFPNKPRETLIDYLTNNTNSTPKELSKKAVVLISPNELLGETIWYKNRSL